MGFFWTETTGSTEHSCGVVGPGTGFAFFYTHDKINMSNCPLSVTELLSSIIMCKGHKDVWGQAIESAYPVHKVLDQIFLVALGWET